MRREREREKREKGRKRRGGEEGAKESEQNRKMLRGNCGFASSSRTHTKDERRKVKEGEDEKRGRAQLSRRPKSIDFAS